MYMYIHIPCMYKYVTSAGALPPSQPAPSSWQHAIIRYYAYTFLAPLFSKAEAPFRMRRLRMYMFVQCAH